MRELSGAVLVGASYGGLVITGLAERAAERLSHLVYVDAYVPRNGETWLDLLPAKRADELRERAATQEDGWRVPCPSLSSFGLSERDFVWISRRTSPQPFASFTQPVQLSDPLAAAIPRTYIRCTENRGLQDQGERARSMADWRYREIATSHLPMLTEPARLAQLLLEVGDPMATGC